MGQGKDQLTYVGIFKSFKFEHRYPARFANLSTALRFFWYSLKRAMIKHLFCANARMMFLKPETGWLDNKISAPPSEWSQTITFLLLHVLYLVSCGSVVEHLGWWSHSHGLEFGYIFRVAFVSWLRNIILCFYFGQNLDNSWLIRIIILRIPVRYRLTFQRFVFDFA